MTDSPQDDFQSFLPRLTEALEMLQVSVSAEVLATSERFARRVCEANQRMNLTSITGPGQVAVKHFADSLSLLKLPLPQGASLIDVGSGGGFPGVPVAIARPDIAVTLLDSTSKKTRFLEEAFESLGIPNCRALAARAETAAHDASLRDVYDVAVARGLGSLSEAAELCLPFVKVGGFFVAMKGPKAAEEIAAARAIIGQLGGRLESSVEAPLPGDTPDSPLAHRLIVVSKLRGTPSAFPRAWSKIRPPRPPSCRT